MRLRDRITIGGVPCNVIKSFPRSESGRRAAALLAHSKGLKRCLLGKKWLVVEPDPNGMGHTAGDVVGG